MWLPYIHIHIHIKFKTRVKKSKSKQWKTQNACRTVGELLAAFGRWLPIFTVSLAMEPSRVLGLRQQCLIYGCVPRLSLQSVFCVVTFVVVSLVAFVQYFIGTNDRSVQMPHATGQVARVNCAGLSAQHACKYIHRVSEKGTFLRASAMLKHVIDIGWTSVCLSVRHTLALHQNGWIYCHAFFTTR